EELERALMAGGFWFELLEHAFLRANPAEGRERVRNYVFLVRRRNRRFVKTICWRLRDAAKMVSKFSNLHGAIAQLGERIVRNDEVVGSIPTSSTILSSTCNLLPRQSGHTFTSSLNSARLSD